MATENLKTIIERFKARVQTAKYVADPWIDGDLWERAAKEYANAHGYFGTVGGWIVKAESQAAATAGHCSKGITQGWDNFRALKRTQILDYYTSLLTASGTFEALVTPESPTYRPTLLVLGPKDWRYAFLASAYDVRMAQRGDRRRAYTGHSEPTEAEVRAAKARTANPWLGFVAGGVKYRPGW